jgi:kynurenine formamidase
MRTRDLGHPSGAGEASDEVTAAWHSPVLTHIDALCHVWDGDGMWNGRDPREAVTTAGTTWGGVEHWRDGFICRGVLLDVPGYRGVPCVMQERPVHGAELASIAAAQQVEVRPGDAVIVYSGLEAWEDAHGVMDPARRPGLHASCLPVIRDWDCALLVWDMQDLTPSGYEVAAWSMHGVLYSYGVGIVDSVVLGPLAAECRRQRAFEFLLLVLPLYIRGGSGSAVNPIAVF